MSHFYGDSIFWIEVERIKPNPYQPRKEFDEERLRDLSESIRMYGVLQPIVVTRKEVVKPDGGLAAEYELISGERRLRAAKLAGIGSIPAIIRTDSDDSKIKLELAIIENLQREDLNPVDRAKAFQRLAEEFSYKHTQIAEKIGRSREYVSNTLRILMLPAEALQALSDGKISEGHTRPLLMLSDRPEEQRTLYNELMTKRMTVRDAENIARRIAYDRVRKKDRMVDPEYVELEEKLATVLGTRVQIERKEQGGKIHIDFFSPQDLATIVEILEAKRVEKARIQGVVPPPPTAAEAAAEVAQAASIAEVIAQSPIQQNVASESKTPGQDDGDDLYTVKNFTV